MVSFSASSTKANITPKPKVATKARITISLRLGATGSVAATALSVKRAMAELKSLVTSVSFWRDKKVSNSCLLVSTSRSKRW